MKYTIALEYKGKQYSFEDEDDYRGWDAHRNADHQVTYIYTEGNFSCDCNRSRFLIEYCDVDFKDDPRAELDEICGSGEWVLGCGSAIKMISIWEGKRIVWPCPSGLKNKASEKALKTPENTSDYLEISDIC